MNTTPKYDELLQRVVVVEAVWLRWQMEGGVVDEDGPGVGHDLPGGRHQAPPLLCAKQQHHEDQAIAHPEQHAKEMPMPGHPDGMPVAGQPNPWRKMTGVVFGRPDAVFGHLNRGEPEPFGAWRAMDVPVQPGMVREDLQATADQQDQEQKVDVVGDAQPRRKAVWLCGCFRDLRRGQMTPAEDRQCPIECTQRQPSAATARQTTEVS